MIFIYISSNSIQHEFFIYLICRAVIKTPEVLVFLDVSKMSLCLNGTCLAFQDSAFALDIGMGSFFQFLPLFIDLYDFVLFGIFLRNVTVDYAFQDINDIPGTLPEGRTKPWGTGQAVLAAKKIIKTLSLSSMQMITMARKVLRLFMSIW